MIIGIIGKKRVGKDTLANHLVEKYGFVKVAFADALKLEVAQILAENCEGTFTVQDYLEKFEADKEYYRPIIQWWGTEFRRKQRDDYWMSKVGDVIAANKNVVVTDARFKNEADYLRAFDAYIIRVTRDLENNDTHSSESENDGYPADMIIMNNDTEDMYRIMIDGVMSKLTVSQEAK